MLQKPILLLLSLLLLASLTACSDDDKDDDGSLSDLPFEELMNNEISFMGFFVDEWMDEIETEVTIFILEEHESVSLTLNGDEIELESFFGFYYAETDYTPGSSVEYNLTVDGNSTSGSITIANIPNGNFPEEFNLNADYSFSWTIASNPQAFVAEISIEDDEDWYDTIVELPGSARNHTFSRDIYSSFDEDDLWYIDAGITAVNFEVNGNMLILSGAGSYETYDFGGGSWNMQAMENESKMPRNRFIRSILK